jgi:hypothetical protein
MLDKRKLMTHSEGSHTAPVYVEQQKKATAIIVSLGSGVTLPQRKGRRLRSKYPLLLP